MAVNEDLIGFVREALARGQSRDDVEAVLRKAGWSGEQVRGALLAFADVTFPIPVPRPRPSLSAREAFMYLLLFSTLYVVAYQLGSLLFQFINADRKPNVPAGPYPQVARVAMTGHTSLRPHSLSTLWGRPRCHH